MLASMGGVYGLNYTVVFETAKSLGIVVNRDFLRMLKAFEEILVKELTKDSAGKSKGTDTS